MVSRALLSLCAATSLAATTAAGQATLPVAKAGPKTQSWTLPRGPDGHPDLQGNWSNDTLTPLVRSSGLDHLNLTEEEAEAYEKQRIQATDWGRPDSSAAVALSRAYNKEFYESGTRLARVDGTARSSLIVDPPDGKVPPLRPEAEKRFKEAIAEARRHPADRPSDRSLDERCLLRATTGPPMFPQNYNNNYQIVQTGGYIMILSEMIHDVRIIALDDRPHLPANVVLWMGDSIGRWEGDTLVVDTTNFTAKAQLTFRNWPSTSNLRVVERFTRTGANSLLYRVTIDDPSTFTRSWTAEIPFLAIPSEVYEYACHEGNYALPNILRGARRDEKESEEASRKGTKQ